MSDKRPRSSQEQIRKRIEELIRVRLDGLQSFDLRPYVADQQTVEGSPWKLEEGQKPWSERQLRRYLSKADEAIADSCRTSRKRLMQRHLGIRRNLLAKAINQGDLRTALACAADEARLVRLYDPVSKPNATDPPSAIADLVKQLAERMQSINASTLPDSEKAKLTATLSDSMLRAFSASDLEKQLADLTARLAAVEGASNAE